MTATPPVALVTGASSGLGKEAAGFRVIGTSRDASRGVAVLRRIVPARMFDKSIRKLNRMVG